MGMFWTMTVDNFSRVRDEEVRLCEMPVERIESIAPDNTDYASHCSLHVLSDWFKTMFC